MNLQFKNNFTDRVHDDLAKNYLETIKNWLSEEVRIMTQIMQSVESFVRLNTNKKQSDYKIGTYKTDLLQLIHQHWGTPINSTFEESHAAYLDSLIKIIDDLAEVHIEEQSKERFITLAGDRLPLQLVKFGKRQLFHISRSPIRIANLFRQDKKNIHYWKHAVPLKKLSARHFHQKMVVETRGVTTLLTKEVNAQYLKIKTWEESLTNKEVVNDATLTDNPREQLQKFEKELYEKAQELVAQIINERLHGFFKDCDRSDTIELFNGQLSDKRMAAQVDKALKNWANHNLEWKNSTYALFEEWRSDLEIHILKHKAHAHLKTFKTGQKKQLTEYIDPEIQEIEGFIKEASSSVSENQETLLSALKKANYLANKKLNVELVPRLCDKLSSQSIVNLVDKLEINIRKNIEKLSQEHVIIKTNNYDQPIASDRLTKISTYELIAFDAWINLENELRKIKKELFHILEQITMASRDLDHVVTFSISSAISAFEDEKTTVEVTGIAQEGFTRAVNRLADNRQALSELMERNNEQLALLINLFSDQILELTVNENVSALRLKITKAKAALQAKEVQVKLKAKLELRLDTTLAAIKTSYAQAKELIRKASEKFILTASKPVLTKEVSDFLMESQQAIDKLPIIYRRLYKVEPIDDMELFEGREVELNAFKLAYDNWNQGRFAATAILGEKCGGLTSFINYATKEGKLPFLITRLVVKRNIASELEFIALMKVLFSNDSFENLDQLVDYLNQNPKRVVVLEDLQNLYLRKVGGFTAIQLLFQLISRTRENVFWVTSMTLNAWSYLSKTINIDDFYSYTITLGELTDDQIVNIIWKRNRISGFNIKFELSEGNKTDKKFKALEEDKQQEILKTKFFRELNKFAKSNISLALTFWLLSTRSLDENTISIGQFQKPDLNFLSVLSANKVYVLHALILHEGLSNAHVSEVINMTNTQIHLIILSLLKDGIIVQKGDLYMVNPIIYRNVIGTLTTKNLIH